MLRVISNLNMFFVNPKFVRKIIFSEKINYEILNILYFKDVSEKINRKFDYSVMKLNSNVSCPAGLFRCFPHDYCISILNVCDGIVDCNNGYDEENCENDYKFVCSNHNQNISILNVCDYTINCLDGSDEKFCSGSQE